MVSIFPDEINILVSDKDTKKPIPNIAIKIKLFSNHKNDYNFILPVSDEKGHIKITRDWLKEEIRKEQVLFVMDYSSMLDDCKPQIEISVLDTKDLSRAINAMYIFQGAIGISNDAINRYKDADNSKYYTCVKYIKLKGVKSLDVDILLKSKRLIQHESEAPNNTKE